MNNYIYISIPKTGSNSIHEILGNTNYNHIKAITVKKLLGDEEYNTKNSFCFIRNPIDLVKSWYYYHKFNPRVPEQEGRLYYPNTIEDWIFKMNCKTHWEEIPHLKNNPHWDINDSPLNQYNWIIDENYNIIVKEIYKFDNINEIIEKKFGIKPNKKNSSNKDNYTLDKKVEDKITELFKNDIHFYNTINILIK